MAFALSVFVNVSCLHIHGLLLGLTTTQADEEGRRSYPF